MSERLILTIDVAKRGGKSLLSPCNVCDQEPLDCGKQYVVPKDENNSLVMCGSKGRVVSLVNSGKVLTATDLGLEIVEVAKRNGNVPRLKTGERAPYFS